MNLPTIKQLVASDGLAGFVRCEDRQLWYNVAYTARPDPIEGNDTGVEVFEFPIPVEDTAGATFLAEDKPIFFMRWMRKHIEYLQRSIDEEMGGPPPHAPPTAVAKPYPPGCK